MSKEMEYFIFLLEQYGRYKSSTANKLISDISNVKAFLLFTFIIISPTGNSRDTKLVILLAFNFYY